MVRYKNVKLTDIFKWQPQKEIDPLKIPALSVDSGIKYPFYGQATSNNGIISYLSLSEKVLNNPQGKPTILIHSNNQNIVFLDTPFYLKDGHGATSVLQADFLNEKNALFIMACIKKVITKKFTYNEKATKIALKNTYISLPVKSDSDDIDYEYMENCVETFEKEQLLLIQKYLKAHDFESDTLTDKEYIAIERFNKKEVNFSPFVLKDIFKTVDNKGKQVPTGAYVSKEQLLPGETPRITVTSSNNGIAGYYHSEDDNYRCYTNFISVSFLGNVFYQPKTASLDMKVHCLQLKNGIELDEEVGLFLVIALQKAIGQATYGEQLSSTDLPQITISLPITQDEQIDYDFMKTYIKAQKKQVTKNLINFMTSSTI